MSIFRKATTSCCVMLACGLLVSPAQASYDDETRIGAVLQVPFFLGGQSVFQAGKIRIGVTMQYAQVEEDQVYRNIVTQSDSIISNEARVDEGNKAYGLEGNLFFEPFGGHKFSAELLGFYGTNEIQGAAGAGYTFGGPFFLDVKAMFPYSEIGMRFLGQTEIYGGLKTLGSFDPSINEHVNVTDSTPPSPPPPPPPSET